MGTEVVEEMHYQLVQLIFTPTGIHLSGYEFARPHRRPFEDEITEHPRVEELLFADFAIGVGMGGPFQESYSKQDVSPSQSLHFCQRCRNI